MITLVIPFIDTYEDFVKPCVEHALKNSRHPFELIMIDNGSEKDYKADIKKLLRYQAHVHYKYIKNKDNLGVVASFTQGLEAATTDIICFIHSDILIHEQQWEKKIEHYFDSDPKLGIAGFLGGMGVHPDGGRMTVLSNFQGIEWGGCACHDIVAFHHGDHIEGSMPVMVLDGVGLFFSRKCLQDIKDNTTALDTEIRAPHHWYDRNLTLTAVELGYHAAVIGVAVDHYNGATANSSEIYNRTARAWLDKHYPGQYDDVSPDQGCYNVGLAQFTDEWAPKLPAVVNNQNEVTWRKTF